MKKSFISFLLGAVLFGTAGVFAGQYVASDNPFPIQLNGQNVSIQGYNIDGNTYFKLRDISSVVGGFSVDFNNNTIQLSKDGYIYTNDSEINSSITGWWFYYHDEEFMDHFSENLCFNSDGTFSSSSWREKTTGNYTVDGNKITVNYDYFYNYAGGREYTYEWSGVRIFVIEGNTLINTSDTYNGKTEYPNKIYEHKNAYTEIN